MEVVAVMGGTAVISDADCGAPGHFARECRSKGTRNLYRRSPSPHYRSRSRRYDSPLSPRDYCRSPRRDKKSPTEKDRWRCRD